MRRLLIFSLPRTVGEQHKACSFRPCKYSFFLNENANSTRISSVSCIISIPSDYYLLFRICSKEKKSSATFSSITTRLDVL